MDIEETPTMNIVGSSNTAEVVKLTPGSGGPGDGWTPATDDTEKTLTITLPDVGGQTPDEYTITEIQITSTGTLGPVDLVVYDTDDNVVYTVSLDLISIVALLVGCTKPDCSTYNCLIHTILSYCYRFHFM